MRTKAKTLQIGLNKILQQKRWEFSPTFFAFFIAPKNKKVVQMHHFCEISILGAKRAVLNLVQNYPCKPMFNAPNNEENP